MNTNIINIKNSRNKFMFPLQIFYDKFAMDNIFYYKQLNDTVVICSSINHNVVNNVNIFEPISADGIEIPHTPAIKLSLMFPEYIDNSISEYVISAHLYINGKKVILGSYLLNTGNNIATDKTEFINGIRFYEKQDIYIPNPYNIMYDDEWCEFRENICGEKHGTNNGESLLIVELYPKTYDNIAPDYHGGYTTLMLDNNDESLKFEVSFDENFDVQTKLSFNAVYGDDFQLYMHETYGISNIFEKYVVKTEIAIIDNDNIYNTLHHIFDENNPIIYIFKKSDLKLTWSDWKVGLKILASFTILDNDENELMTMFSEPLPLLLDSFAYLLANTPKIELNSLDMKTYNLDIVNKIEKHIVTVSTVDNDNANIIANTFVFANKIEDLIIYPNVIQNIMLPLNSYKNKVSVMYLMIEGIIFSEIGRMQQGVIFKVDGNQLPNKTTSGSYFILNDNKEMITTGNYTYKQ